MDIFHTAQTKKGKALVCHSISRIRGKHHHVRYSLFFWIQNHMNTRKTGWPRVLRKAYDYRKGKQMRKFLWNCSSIFPLLLIYFVFTEDVSFSITEFHLYLDHSEACFLAVMITVIWLCSPFRTICCDGSWGVVFYNIFPIATVGMLNLAQWYFGMFVTMLIITAIAETVLLIGLKRAEKRHLITKKSQRKFYRLLPRYIVAVAVVVCAGPSLYNAVSNGFISPFYYEIQDYWRAILSNMDAKSDQEESANSLPENEVLWMCLDEDKWKTLSVQERITVLKHLMDYETDILDIPPIEIHAGLIGDATMGVYDHSINMIEINVEHLDLCPVEEVIDTVCHEVRHAFQWQVVDSIDWDNPVFQAPYFEEMRSWLENYHNYKSVWIYGYDEYENQPVEVDARDYAKKETERIMEKVRKSNEYSKSVDAS